MINSNRTFTHLSNATHKHFVARLAWSGQTRKQFEALFAQSMWCLGQDILAPEGNLLVAYGLNKTKATDAPPKTASQYHQGPLTLWAFGLAWENLFISRHRPRPSRLKNDLPPTPLWERTQLPPTYWPEGIEALQLRQQLSAFCQWMAAYENWVTTHSPHQRPQSLARWNQRPAVQSPDIVRVWRHLAQAIAQLPVA